MEKPTSPIDVAPLIDESLKNMGPRELQIVVYLNQAIMNFIMKNSAIQDTIISISNQEDFF
jgi:hypothetical protein